LLKESENFPQNKAIENLLEAEISRLNLGNEYHATCAILKDLNSLKDSYENLKSTPEDFVYEKFHAMRQKVDLIREDLIQKINDCSDKIIAEIDSYENECKQNLSRLNPWPKEFDISTIRDELSAWEGKMKKLYYDEELCSTIRDKSKDYKERIKTCHNELIDRILSGKANKYIFENKYSNVVDIFCKHLNFSKYTTNLL
jgi:hypothetical protein